MREKLRENFLKYFATSDMLRTEVKRDDLVEKDCRVKWPQKNKQPYYLIEERFSQEKGIERIYIRVP